MMECAPILLIAPDSSKGTYSVAEVAGAIAGGIRSAGTRIDLPPVADGGEGTLAILVRALGDMIASPVVTGQFGLRVRARYGLLDGGSTAIIEATEACGLGLAPVGERDAEAASTCGVGELTLHARSAGVQRIVVTIGGSATTADGQGALDAVRLGCVVNGVTVDVLCDASVVFEDTDGVSGS